MQIIEITYDDISSIRDLQPEGWPDITETIKNYIDFPFCRPIKVILENRIVGIGASIMFQNTGWLAHIIVHKDYRNRGIGFHIVQNLLQELSKNGVHTVLLIATELGEPVYIKSGFKIISDYIYLKREFPWIKKPVSQKIVPYKDSYYEDIIKLDKKISGENRAPLIKMYLDNSLVYLDNKKIKGLYLPDLGEGLIIADVPLAGLALMKVKYSNAEVAVIPCENKVGIDFLKKNGFVVCGIKGKRMLFGKKLNWNPEGIYSRIGGNYG